MSLTIGRVAAGAGVNIQTVRYYERRGLLPEPPRSRAGYRQYGPEQPNLNEILRDVESLMAHSTFLSEKSNFVMDITMGRVNVQQNKVVKLLSIAATVFLPPTLVASIYGMNFRFMPELHWSLGYPLAVALMLVSAVAPYWYLKRKGWL